MTKLCSASIALLATILMVACGDTDRSDPRTDAAVAGTPATSTPANTSAVAATMNAEPQTAVNPQGAATLEFHKRIDAYMKIHNEAESKVPSLKRTDDPQEISVREKALGQMIMTLRAGAAPGDVFAPEYQPHLIKIIQDDFAHRSAADRKALVAELPAKVKVDINTVYPTTLPLETLPPALLSKLPDLPPELEYRIVGRTLLLRDVKANLIVDILRDVVPTIPS
jgi:hypothetical protein